MRESVEIALIGSIAPTLASIGAMVLGILNRRELVEVKHNTNSLTANLVRVEKKISFTEGVEKGKHE
jgi:hypothetical protein